MSDTNRINLSYVEETGSFGVTPSSALQRMRFTAESLRQETQSIQSNEIESSRNVNELIRVGINAAGTIDWELSYGTYDDLLAAMLGSAGWSSPITMTADTVIVVASAGTFTFGAQNPSSAGIAVGQWVHFTGFSNAGNNGYFKVSAVSSTVVTVSNKDNLVDETGSGDEVCVQGAQIVNGVALPSFSFEREYADLSNTFAAYTGCVVDSGSLNIALQAATTGSIDVLGVKEESKTATIGSGSYTAAPTTKIFNTVDHISGIVEGNSTIGVQSVSAAFANNIRQRLEVGALGPQSMGAGQFVATGTLAAYFTAARSALADKFLNWTDTSLSWIAVDTAGNAYVIDFPLVKVSAGPRNTPGANQDIVLALNWQATKHATEGITARIVKFAA